MIPWDDDVAEQLEKLESQPGDAAKLIAQLKQATLVVAVGLRDDFLLVSVGPSTEILAKLGHGPSLAPGRSWPPWLSLPASRWRG